jgi:hypothetical protein
MKKADKKSCFDEISGTKEKRQVNACLFLLSYKNALIFLKKGVLTTKLNSDIIIPVLKKSNYYFI